MNARKWARHITAIAALLPLFFTKTARSGGLFHQASIHWLIVRAQNLLMAESTLSENHWQNACDKISPAYHWSLMKQCPGFRSWAPSKTPNSSHSIASPPNLCFSLDQMGVHRPAWRSGQEHPIPAAAAIRPAPDQQEEIHWDHGRHTQLWLGQQRR